MLIPNTNKHKTPDPFGDSDEQNESIGFSRMAGSQRDWPEDFSHENGNYLRFCVECGEPFTGHKRRCVCKMCDDVNQKFWDSLTVEEQKELVIKNRKTLEKILSENGESEVSK